MNMNDAARLLDEQLDELLRLDRRISRRSVELARLVLVGGMSQAQAARAVGLVHRQYAHHALKVVKRALTRGGICRVCGASKTSHQREEVE